jgi:outer membrane protein assembly factor BamD
MGPVVTITQHFDFSRQIVRLAGVGAVVVLLAGCSLFGQPKIKEEEIIPPETLYQQALSEMDAQRYMTAVQTLEKLERQHPYSEFNEKAKLMEVYGNYRIGKFDEAIMAADRYMALYPGSKETAYVLYLKGNSYFGQIKDITRDQKISQQANEVYSLLISNYPDSDYAKDAKDKLTIGADQLAGKEMSVGRYYLGQGQYAAAINRFKVVATQYQTSTHVEESLFRLTEANLALGLTSEAATAAAVLGHNYPQSKWYKQAYDLLAKQGVKPEVNSGSPLAKLQQG